jgi:hypothetical protein
MMMMPMVVMVPLSTTTIQTQMSSKECGFQGCCLPELVPCDPRPPTLQRKELLGYIHHPSSSSFPWVWITARSFPRCFSAVAEEWKELEPKKKKKEKEKTTTEFFCC